MMEYFILWVLLGFIAGSVLARILWPANRKPHVVQPEPEPETREAIDLAWKMGKEDADAGEYPRPFSRTGKFSESNPQYKSYMSGYECGEMAKRDALIKANPYTCRYRWNLENREHSERLKTIMTTYRGAGATFLSPYGVRVVVMRCGWTSAYDFPKSSLPLAYVELPMGTKHYRLKKSFFPVALAFKEAERCVDQIQKCREVK